jgi:hypothetical protein
VSLGGDYDREGRTSVWIEEGNIRMKCGDLKVRDELPHLKALDLPQRDANLSVVGRRLDSPIYIFGSLISSQSLKRSKL